MEASLSNCIISKIIIFVLEDMICNFEKFRKKQNTSETSAKSNTCHAEKGNMTNMFCNQGGSQKSSNKQGLFKQSEQQHVNRLKLFS